MDVRVTFENGSKEHRTAELSRPSGSPRAWALLAHCLDEAAAGQVRAALRDRGIGVLSLDWGALGAGAAPGLDDLVAAAAFLRSSERAPRILIGHGLGGTAMLAAARHLAESAAVAVIGAPWNVGQIRRLLAPATPELAGREEVALMLGQRRFRMQEDLLRELEAYPPAEQVARWQKALLLAHVPGDPIMDTEELRPLFEAAAQPKSLMALDGADVLLGRAADAAYVGSLVAAWAERYLGSEAPAEPQVAEGTVLVRERAGLAQEILAGRHRLQSDEPVSLGGGGTGPTPYELLLAALGACTSMTLRMYAGRKQWPLEGVEVVLRHEKIHARDCEECETKVGKVDRIDREIRLAGPLDEAQRRRLLEIADKCPVHMTLHKEVQVTSRLVDTQGTPSR